MIATASFSCDLPGHCPYTRRESKRGDRDGKGPETSRRLYLAFAITLGLMQIQVPGHAESDAALVKGEEVISAWPSEKTASA